MENDNYILVSLDDEKSKIVAEVLASQTCKKIISYLSENKEASQKDLSVALKIPMNTVEYNIKKLVSSGFIQKRKNFFWSKKGKKIVMYELSKKSVIISHKKTVSNKLKSIVPAFILTGALTFAIYAYEKIKGVSTNVLRVSKDTMYAASENIVSGTTASATPTDLITATPNPLWLWFLVGGLLSIFIISIVNWRKL